MIKPAKQRLQIYGLLLCFTIIISLVLLFTGYDYRKNKGFFSADGRDPMSFGEVLSAFPVEYIYILFALVGIIASVELVIFVFRLVFRRT